MAIALIGFNAKAENEDAEPIDSVFVIELQKLPEVGDTLSPELPGKIYKCSHCLMTSASQFDLFFIADVEGILYDIAFNNDRIASFITTVDTAFISPESVRVGMPMADVMKTTGAKELSKMSGFAYYIPLESGWNAGFGVDDYNSGILTKDSVVTWLFKY